MVYTTLLEPYYSPQIIPIEVTVLRGARRLRLGSSLRRKYNDFTPKIWNILAKLGYQKYLQKIYVNIEFPHPVTSSYYQLPIVVAILDGVGMLRLRSPLYSIGRFLADYTISYPEFTESNEIPGIKTTPLIPGEKIEQYLNHIHTTPVDFKTPKFDTASLFPGVAFQGTAINLTKTPISILRKIPEQTWKNGQFFITLRKNSLSEQLLNFIALLPLNKKHVVFDYKKCFCEQIICICTKYNKSLHTEQLLFLKEIFQR
ncbi:hypothetical protein IT418_04135 [bacterium]|nr:hypothetical protein [bacterium]